MGGRGDQPGAVGGEEAEGLSVGPGELEGGTAAVLLRNWTTSAACCRWACTPLAGPFWLQGVGWELFFK